MKSPRHQLIAFGFVTLCGFGTGSYRGTAASAAAAGGLTPADDGVSRAEEMTGAGFRAADSSQPANAKQTASPADPPPRPDLVRYPYSQADVDFMGGMIPHHAQAVLIAGWAESHGARLDIRVLCERMVIGQRDEIEYMRNWLRDRGEAVPAANATHHRMKMNGVEHDMLMAGMLSAEELAQLDRARGPDWDRLFLTFMIRHHEGAIKMIDDLFASYGALQDDDVYKLASDMYADQTTEIERMQKMLASMDKAPHRAKSARRGARKAQSR